MAKGGYVGTYADSLQGRDHVDGVVLQVGTVSFLRQFQRIFYSRPFQLIGVRRLFTLLRERPEHDIGFDDQGHNVPEDQRPLVETAAQLLYASSTHASPRRVGKWQRCSISQMPMACVSMGNAKP